MLGRVCSYIRTRRGVDVHFLANTFGISVSQVSRIPGLSPYQKIIIPCPLAKSGGEIKRVLPKRFQRIPKIRVIINCCEFYIQKPVILESQKDYMEQLQALQHSKVTCWHNNYWGHFLSSLILDWEYF